MPLSPASCIQHATIDRASLLQVMLEKARTAKKKKLAAHEKKLAAGEEARRAEEDQYRFQRALADVRLAFCEAVDLASEV